MIKDRCAAPTPHRPPLESYQKFSETEGQWRVGFDVDTTKPNDWFGVDACEPVFLMIYPDIP